MKHLATLLVTALLTGSALAGPTPEAAPKPENAGHRMDWWREARFGLFIHWGLYAIPAGEWKGSTNHAEWILTTAQIPVAQYENFVERFNPVEFDADEWARIAKNAGMKYIVITSKHHDGFCLFDSAHTDYDIMSTPFRRDIMKELAAACRRHGLKMCWYHSIMDWNHPDYLPRRGWEKRSAEGADFDRYVEHLHRQVEELLTNYGDIGVMWFDGEWESTWTNEHGQKLYDLCRRLQPKVIVNNRVDKGRGGMAGMTSDRKYAGDFGTPEQEIPTTGMPGVDWETCMTMNRHWGYNKNDHDWKSTADLIRKLVDIASKGGNFLLNVGPTPEGRIPAPSVERLAAMGDWMRRNGPAIYGTTASPFAELPWGRCTVGRRGNRTELFLHVFDWPAGELVVPGLGNRVRSAYLLEDPTTELSVSRHQGSVHVRVPADAPDPVCSVVTLVIDGTPIVYEMPTITAAADILVRSLEVTLTTRSQDLVIRYTLDGSEPTVDAPVYAAPFTVSDTTVVKAVSFHEDLPVSAVAAAVFTRATPAPATRLTDPSPGLVCGVYEGKWDELPRFDALTPTRTETRSTVGLPAGPAVEYVARRYTGYVRVPSDDVYVFALDSDDGSRLKIHGRVVIDNDGLHGPREKTGTVALAAGLHEIEVEWFNKTGGAELDLRFAPVGGKLVPVNATSLVHD